MVVDAPGAATSGPSPGPRSGQRERADPDGHGGEREDTDGASQPAAAPTPGRVAARSGRTRGIHSHRRSLSPYGLHEVYTDAFTVCTSSPSTRRQFRSPQARRIREWRRPSTSRPSCATSGLPEARRRLQGHHAPARRSGCVPRGDGSDDRALRRRSDEGGRHRSAAGSSSPRRSPRRSAPGSFPAAQGRQAPLGAPTRTVDLEYANETLEEHAIR